MDNEIIERVELAIRLAIYSDNKGTKEAALVAMKAMREPTEKMIRAGDEANPTMWNDGTDYKFISDVSNDIWISMIDSIFND